MASRSWQFKLVGMSSKSVSIFYKICYFTAAVAYLYDRRTDSFYFQKNLLFYGTFYQLIFTYFVHNGPLNISRDLLVYGDMSLISILHALDTLAWTILIVIFCLSLMRDSQIFVNILNDLRTIQKTLAYHLHEDFSEQLNQRIQFLLICCGLTLFFVLFGISKIYDKLTSDFIPTCGFMPCVYFTTAAEIAIFFNVECGFDSLNKILYNVTAVDGKQIRIWMSLHDEIISISRRLARTYMFTILIGLVTSWIMIPLYLYYNFDSLAHFDYKQRITFCVTTSCLIYFLLLIVSCHFWHHVLGRVSFTFSVKNVLNVLEWSKKFKESRLLGKKNV